MAHYAFLDESNIVIEVITGRDEDETVDGISDWEKHYGDFRGLACKRTSYNTYANQHNNGGTPFRGNYAGIGYLYDPIRDAFIAPKANCHSEEVIDETTCSWVCSNAEHTEPIND